jgi:hypothetical protein
MKTKMLTGIFAVIIVLLLVSCGKDYSGEFTGYSWKGESKGVSFEEAVQKIETVLVLDKKGNITAASIDFLKKSKSGDSWYKRDDSKATVSVDFSIDPSLAQTQSDDQDYAAGSSMFSIKTNDKMSFFAVAVDSDSTLAFVLVDPMHRYMSEIKLSAGFDYTRPIKDLTIANGLLIPTVRTSSSGSLKPKNWEDHSNKHIFGFYRDEYVYTSRGTFKGLSSDDSIQDLMEKAGVSFSNGSPQSMDIEYGFYAAGGWTGNYEAIESFLVGKNANDLKSLIDWSIPRYSKAVNDKNFFGVDLVSGATKTVQNSADGIAGATVRASREATSYQRALVAAGVLTEEEVIKGRF